MDIKQKLINKLVKQTSLSLQEFCGQAIKRKGNQFIVQLALFIMTYTYEWYSSRPLMNPPTFYAPCLRSNFRNFADPTILEGKMGSWVSSPPIFLPHSFYDIPLFQLSNQENQESQISTIDQREWKSGRYKDRQVKRKGICIRDYTYAPPYIYIYIVYLYCISKCKFCSQRSPFLPMDA